MGAGTRDLFGTDGIRGVAGLPPLDGQTAMQVGKAVGTYFAEPGELIIIGYDPRESSYALAMAITAGLAAVGVTTKVVGVLPTPGLAYLTKISKAKSGVMITASHNPYTDNGIKVFSSLGGKLPDNTEAKLNDLIGSIIPNRGFGQPTEISYTPTSYEDFLVDSCDGSNFEDLNIILDTANGATSGVAERVFTRLGANVTAIFDEPDGRNINVQCGATHTEPLQTAVTDADQTIGAAFDGDGDRVMLVDEKGRQLTGDHVLYILAVTGRHETVVATIMSNMGFELALKKQNIKLERVAVGDRYVLEALEKTGLQLGGEQSGHIIMTTLASTGDGILAAIQVLKNVRASGRTLASWRDEVELMPQKLVNFPLPDKATLKDPKIVAYVESETNDLGDKGRLNIRPSGTEPIARVMVESPDADKRAQRIADHLVELIDSLKVAA